MIDPNGILGVGLRRQDCAAGCEAVNPAAVYFTCAGGPCTPTPVARANQVGNPITALGANNNGLAGLLPSVPPGGSSAVTGPAILGIATQPNNALGAARVFAQGTEGFLAARYKGASYCSCIDTGTNSVRFPAAVRNPQPARGSADCCARGGRLSSAYGHSVALASQA